jgi:hypothetical protein
MRLTTKARAKRHENNQPGREEAKNHHHIKVWKPTTEIWLKLFKDDISPSPMPTIQES